MSFTYATDTERENCETVTTWVEEATAGFLTAEYIEYDVLAIKRADGKALDGKAFAPFPDLDPSFAVRFSLINSPYTKLNRTHRKAMRRLVLDVAAFLLHYVSEPEAPATWALTLHDFETRNHLR